MFSQLGPLFKTVFRKTEHADARFEIRREEKDNPKKEEDEAEEKLSDDDLWQDSTAVSVLALRTFLIDFLKTKGEATQEEITASENMEGAINTPHPAPANPMAARAHRAYANMASYAQSPPPPPENTTEKTVNLSDLLAVDEVRTMHMLIAKLDRLHKRGIETLVIEKADSFLQALVLAVEKIDQV